MNEIQRLDAPRHDREQITPERPTTARDLMVILWRHLWLILLILVVSTATAAVISRHTPRAWRATAELLLVQRAPMMAITPQASASAPMVESMDTQISLLQSHALAQTAAATVGVDAARLQGAMTVTPPKDGDNVIDLAVEADSHEHAVAWANAVCQAFVQYKKQVAQHNSQETLLNLKGQAAQAKKQMAVADDLLLQFAKTHNVNGIGVLDADAQKSAALNAVLSQDTVVAGYKNDYATAQARANSLAKQLQTANAAIKNGTGVRDNDEILKMQEDLHTQQRNRQQVAERYTKYFPGKLAPLDAQIADTQARLDQAIKTLQSQPSLAAQGQLQDSYASARTEAESARVKLAAAEQQRSQLQQETVNLPQISMESDKLTQNAAQAHTLYNALNAAVRAAQLDTDVASGNVQIVQPAYAPEAPIRPSCQKDLLAGFGIGVFLSLIAILLLEQSDRSVRSAGEVRRLANGPVVGVLPQMTRMQRVQLSRGETPTPLIETYNAARASLSLAMRSEGSLNQNGHKVLLISSTIAGEGKSLSASELAQSYARAGRRVILVNADMRRPSSLPLLRPTKDSAPGLAEVLAGKATLAEALSPSEIENLTVLRSGVPHCNPTDLLSQPQTGETIRALREAAEIVVLDSPPAAIVADAMLLAPYADSVLYVVSVGMVDPDSIRNTVAALAAATTKKISYLINRAPQTGSGQGYYHGYYNTPLPLEDHSRDHSPWRTRSLDRAFLAQRDDTLDAPAHGENGARPAGDQEGSVEHDAETTRIWTQPAIRILPDVGSHLVALEGPYFSQKFALSPSKPLTLGILPDNDIVLARDGTISRRHARIAPEEGGYVLYDDEATNGTFVNDIPVTRQPLQVGDMIQLGASKFRYE